MREAEEAKKTKWYRIYFPSTDLKVKIDESLANAEKKLCENIKTLKNENILREIDFKSSFVGEHFGVLAFKRSDTIRQFLTANNFLPLLMEFIAVKSIFG